MKVITCNPITLDGKRLNTTDMYLSASGFSADDVKQFQDWLDSANIKFVGATNTNRDNGKALNQGAGYGNFGPSTKAAYGVHGWRFENHREGTGRGISTLKAYYESLSKPSSTTSGSTTTSGSSKPIVPTSGTGTQTSTNAELPKAEEKSMIAKFKEMSTTNKVLLIGGSILGVVLIGYIVKRAMK